MVTVGCLSKADAVESAADIALWRNYIEELNQGELLEGIVSGDGETLFQAEESDESENPNSGAGPGRVAPGDEDVQSLWRFRLAEEK